MSQNLRAFYPYHELLPLQTAHDVYVMHNCAGLARAGVALDLGIDRRSWRDEPLLKHYGVDSGLPMNLQRFFSLRKSGPFKLTWNIPFFLGCQSFIRRHRPDFVLCSVIKQGAYHFSRRIPGVRYVYEVHQLARYPNGHQASAKAFELERRTLASADLVVVTTEALKEVLQQAPYNLQVPVEVLPLATTAQALPPKALPSGDFCLMYVGQLYRGQGVEQLLAALAETQGIRLEIVGGSHSDIGRLKTLSQELKLGERVHFHGFLPPSKLPPLVQQADGFAAPFRNEGRMPYVAHTKLYEYAAWGRPVLAPDLPVTREHFSGDSQLLAYQADDHKSMVQALQCLPEKVGAVSSAHQTFDWLARGQRYRQLLDIC